MIRPSFATGAAVLAIIAPQVHAADSNTAAPSWRPDDIVITATLEGQGYATQTASATRTPVPLLNVPQSVQVLNETLIREQALTTLAGALTNVSGVVPSRPQEAVLAYPIIRGFGADIFIDGLPAYALTAVNDPAGLTAFSRIEVAKGPTSALFGGGIGAPVGGLINLVSKTPQDKAVYTAEFRTGAYGTVNPSFDLNQPLGDAVAVRFTGNYNNSQSYIAFTGSDALALNPSVRFSFGENTDLVVLGSYSLSKQLEYAGLPESVIGLPGVDSFQFSGATDAPRTRIENKMLTGVLTHRFSDSISATLQARHYDSQFDEYGSFPFPAFYPPLTATAYPLIKAYLPTSVNQDTVDASVLATVSTGSVKHVLLAGAQYDDTNYDAAMGIDYFPIGVIDYAVPWTAPPFGAVPPIDAFALLQTDQYQTVALYVQDQVQIGERLNLLASLRWTSLSYTQIKGGTTDENYSKLSPRLGISYDVAEGVALYAAWAQGFRATLNFIGAVPPVPQTSDTFEGGIKFARTQWGLSGTISVYQLTRQNVPTADPLNPFQQVQTGEQRSRGLEVDLVWEPTPAFSVLANYALTDAEVTADTNIPVGDTLARVPRNSGRVAARYRVQDGALRGLGFGLGVTAASSSQLTLPNSVSVAGYAVADAQASYQVGPLSFGISVTNLFNRSYYLPYQYLAMPQVIPGQPRSAFVTMGASF